MKKVTAVIMLLTMLLTGCRQTAQARPRLVTGITADYSSGTIRLHRQYTNEEKMRSVLTYLRCLDPYGVAYEAAEQAGGSRVQIVLTYSDGSTKTYEQRADQYLRIGDSVWRNISAEKGRELPLLLGLMESD